MLQSPIRKIIEIKRPIDLVFVELENGKRVFVSKSELNHRLVKAYHEEIRGEGGDQL
jgi:hypothetical protein